MADLMARWRRISRNAVPAKRRIRNAGVKVIPADDCRECANCGKPRNQHYRKPSRKFEHEWCWAFDKNARPPLSDDKLFSVFTPRARSTSTGN